MPSGSSNSCTTCGTECSEIRQKGGGGGSRETEEHNYLTWPHTACRYWTKQRVEFITFVLLLTSAKALSSRWDCKQRFAECTAMVSLLKAPLSVQVVGGRLAFVVLLHTHRRSLQVKGAEAAAQPLPAALPAECHIARLHLAVPAPPLLGDSNICPPHQGASWLPSGCVCAAAEVKHPTQTFTP